VARPPPPFFGLAEDVGRNTKGLGAVDFGVSSRWLHSPSPPFSGREASGWVERESEGTVSFISPRRSVGRFHETRGQLIQGSRASRCAASAIRGEWEGRATVVPTHAPVCCSNSAASSRVVAGRWATLVGAGMWRAGVGLCAGEKAKARWAKTRVAAQLGFFSLFLLYSFFSFPIFHFQFEFNFRCEIHT
jgi:hypothetical protein